MMSDIKTQDTKLQDTKLNTLNENAVAQSTCSNCQAMVDGQYCGQCGQSTESSIKYFWTVILHILDDVFSFDSRASRTLWPLLTRPGFLTNEYVLGRRVHYVPPLRLYIFISIVFFITLKFFAASENNPMINIDDHQKALTQVTQHISELELKLEKLKHQENTVPSESQEGQFQAIQRVQKNIDVFKKYHHDLSTQDNKLLIAVTTELVTLEFKKSKANPPLSDKDQKRYLNLTERVIKIKNGEKLKIMNIGNSSDGTLSLPFLSAKKNQVLNNVATKLEEKASNAFQNGTGPLLQQVIGKMPQLMFVLLPLFAALLKIMYLFSNRFYLEHLTVALHSHSFVFLNLLQLEIIDMVQDTFLKTSPKLDSFLSLISFILMLWIPIYLFIMQKRVYKQGYIMTCIKYVIVGMTYSALIGITAIIAFVWGLWDL